MTLSRELRRRLPSLSDGKKLRGETVFPYDTRRQMLGVHLFFVKLLGCELADSGDSPFAEAPFLPSIQRATTLLVVPKSIASFICVYPPDSYRRYIAKPNVTQRDITFRN